LNTANYGYGQKALEHGILTRKNTISSRQLAMAQG
jgi:hypothetical protein